MPASEATKNFFICGGVGTGKSLAVQLFLQSIAPRFRPDHAGLEQLIVFDAKGDILPLLATAGLRPEDGNVFLLNPFDQRCATWNMAEAVQEPAMARSLATLLVPPHKNSAAPYFSDAARELVYAVVLALNTIMGKAWTFRDLLCAMESPDRIRRVCGRGIAGGIQGTSRGHESRSGGDVSRQIADGAG